MTDGDNFQLLELEVDDEIMDLPEFLEINEMICRNNGMNEEEANWSIEFIDLLSRMPDKIKFTKRDNQVEIGLINSGPCVSIIWN